jgi:hypothetical protein
VSHASRWLRHHWPEGKSAFQPLTFAQFLELEDYLEAGYCEVGPKASKEGLCAEKDQKPQTQTPGFQFFHLLQRQRTGDRKKTRLNPGVEDRKSGGVAVEEHARLRKVTLLG